MLIKLYKIRYLNLEKALLFPRNQAICLRNWKLWRAPISTKFNIFCWNFAHVSYLTMSAKECINKNVKNECLETSSFLIFANNSRSKQNEKNPEHPFVDIGK